MHGEPTRLWLRHGCRRAPCAVPRLRPRRASPTPASAKALRQPRLAAVTASRRPPDSQSAHRESIGLLLARPVRVDGVRADALGALCAVSEGASRQGGERDAHRRTDARTSARMPRVPAHAAGSPRPSPRAEAAAHFPEQYRTDNFMMFGFKVAMCNRQGRHPWADCPFAHPTENARRRDPRLYSYNCVECPAYRCALALARTRSGAAPVPSTSPLPLGRDLCRAASRLRLP